ncbi:hypothetical protein F2Q70_00035811 [Brassica cretica]|uniref:Uncharacterized protein n=1 Tax=Brassica cretica TaxID=69181 RepID=A0A8S9JSX6_BRACR|nr:hypothetical protein F2Q68_00031031 [Brassica cretica]KAF2584798.1 hypothetical protein F2Q70_00035811 [Brassica cretica]
MQLETKKHEVSQYLQSAHVNRHAEARVSRCMNTRHAEGQVYVKVSSGMAREHAKGHAYIHVSPRMQPEACGMTYMRLGGESPDQSIQDIDVGFWDLTSRYQDEDLEGVPDIGDGFRARKAGPV